MPGKARAISEVGRDGESGEILVQVDPRYFRPTEVDELLGDPTKAQTRLGWKPKVSFDDLIKIMVREDIKEAEKDQMCRRAGFLTYNQFE